MAKVYSPVSFPFKGPNTNTSFYLLDLSGLPPETAQGLRKVEIFSGQASSLAELFLTADTQLHKGQGKHVFGHVTKASVEARPLHLQFRPGAADVPRTLESLQQLHEAANDQRQQLAAAAAPNPVAEGSANAAVADPSAPAIGIDLDSAAPGRATAKRKRSKGPQPPPQASLQAQPPQAVPETPVTVPSSASPATVAGSDLPPSSGGRVSARSRLLAGLDEEMRAVAERHLQVQPNASVKCLESLTPEAFLGKSESTRQNANALTGAARS